MSAAMDTWQASENDSQQTWRTCGFERHRSTLVVSLIVAMAMIAATHD